MVDIFFLWSTSQDHCVEWWQALDSHIFPITSAFKSHNSCLSCCLYVTTAHRLRLCTLVPPISRSRSKKFSCMYIVHLCVGTRAVGTQGGPGGVRPFRFFRTRAIISRGLYIFYLFLKTISLFLSTFFLENSVLICIVCIQERVIMARVRYMAFYYTLSPPDFPTFLWLCEPRRSSCQRP